MATTMHERGETFSTPERSNFARAMRRLLRHRSGQIGGVVVLTLVFFALAGESVLPYETLAIDPINRLQPPSLEHFFGPDELGRDLFSRILYGSRYTLMIGLVSTAIAATGGITLGLLAGGGGKLADMLIMRVVDVLLAFPYILLLLAIIAILGPSLWTSMFAVGVAGIPGYARLIRGEVLALKEATGPIDAFLTMFGLYFVSRGTNKTMRDLLGAVAVFWDWRANEDAGGAHGGTS